MTNANKRLKAKRHLFWSGNIIGVLSVLAFVGIWFVVSLFTRSVILPSPIDVFSRSISVFHDTLLSDIIHSLYRIFTGLILGSVVGIALGVAVSWNKFLGWWCDPLIELIRPVPVLALIPLFILWFGIGELGKISLIAFGAFVRQIVTTREAIKNVPVVYLRAAQTLGAVRKATLFRTVIFPAITPELIGGIRVTVAAAFGYCAAAEFLGAQQGIGYMLIRARRYLYTFGVLFAIILLSTFSWIADRVVRLIDRRLNAWAERTSRTA